MGDLVARLRAIGWVEADEGADYIERLEKRCGDFEAELKLRYARIVELERCEADARTRLSLIEAYLDMGDTDSIRSAIGAWHAELDKAIEG